MPRTKVETVHRKLHGMAQYLRDARSFEMGGKHVEASHLKTLIDCANACRDESLCKHLPALCRVVQANGGSGPDEFFPIYNFLTRRWDVLAKQ
jgi:hypothetical protein